MGAARPVRHFLPSAPLVAAKPYAFGTGCQCVARIDGPTLCFWVPRGWCATPASDHQSLQDRICHPHLRLHLKRPAATRPPPRHTPISMFPAGAAQLPAGGAVGRSGTVVSCGAERTSTLRRPSDRISWRCCAVLLLPGTAPLLPRRDAPVGPLHAFRIRDCAAMR